MRVAVLLILLATVIFAGGTEGVIFGSRDTKPVADGEAIRSQADWYDVKELNGALDTASTITIATYFGTTVSYMCKAIYNNSGTATTIRIATNTSKTPAAGDTIRYKLDAYQTSAKLPALAKIFKLAETDSLILFMQIEN